MSAESISFVRVDYSLFTPDQLLQMDISTERQEEVLVDRVVVEGALIDPNHCLNLSESMKGSRGQISPVTLRARYEDSDIVYDVIDGFHRCGAKRLIEKEVGNPQCLKAIVLYGCSDEEMYDLRVLAANSVKSIKFARMAEWMKGSFENTNWNNPRIFELISSGEITLSQVFTLAQFDSSGRNLGLDINEVEELKSWGVNKSNQWRKPLSTLMVEMRTVELSAPDLVQQVRTGGGGKGGRGVLTRARLEAIVRNLPGEWETQRLFAEMAIKQNILASDLDYLSWSYVFAKEADDNSTMNKILENPEHFINPPKIEPTEIVPDYDSANRLKYSRVDSFGRGSKKSRRECTRRTKHSDDSLLESENQGDSRVNEMQVLINNNIPEILTSLIDMAITNQNNSMTLLLLPHESLKLQYQNKIIELGGKKIELTDQEIKLMTTLSLLEGIRVPENILSVINISSGEIKIKDIARSLQRKIAYLSKEVSMELMINKQSEYGWLIE